MGRPFCRSPQGLAWRGNTGESSRQGGLGPPPATTNTIPPEADHPHKENGKEGPNYWTSYTDTKDASARGYPKLHKKSTVREPKRSQADNASGPTYSTRTEWLALHRIPGRGRGYILPREPPIRPSKWWRREPPRADEGR